MMSRQKTKLKKGRELYRIGLKELATIMEVPRMGKRSQGINEYGCVKCYNRKSITEIQIG